MKKLLIVVIACYALTSRAQVHESKNFIYLYSDSVIYAKDIRLRPDFSGYLQLRADSRKVPTEQVKFFSNEDGFFANTRRLHFGSTTSFSERIIEGKINVFQQEDYYPYQYDHRYRRNRYIDRRPQAVDVKMYYNKGYADLKKANYHNLSADMADNPKAMDMLKNYRKSINTGKTMYIVAGAAIVSGLISFLAAGSSNRHMSSGNGFGSNFGKGPNFTPAFILLGAGAGLATGGYFIQASGNRHLENAVDAYNR